MSQYFSELYERSSRNVKVELDLTMQLSNYPTIQLSNYPMKANLKGAIGTDTSTLASKADLAGLKTNEYAN